MNVKLVKAGKYIFLCYAPELAENFLLNLKRRHESCSGNHNIDLKNTFVITYQLYEETLKLRNRLCDDASDDENGYYFVIGEEGSKFYKFNKTILHLYFDLYFQKDLTLNIRYFTTSYGYSAFRTFNNFYHNDNIIDIITYDDLIWRLNNIINSL